MALVCENPYLLWRKYHSLIINDSILPSPFFDLLHFLLFLSLFLLLLTEDGQWTTLQPHDPKYMDGNVTPSGFLALSPFNMGKYDSFSASFSSPPRLRLLSSSLVDSEGAEGCFSSNVPLCISDQSRYSRLLRIFLILFCLFLPFILPLRAL